MERLNRHLSVVLSARLFVELQKIGVMPEGPGKSAAWHQLVVGYEEEEVTRLVREEMKRRYPKGFPEGYRPPCGSLP